MIHFNWTTYWPHAVPDMSETLMTTSDPKDVTCDSCKHALGGQQQAPPR